MNEEMAEEAKKKVVKAWGKLLPFGAQVVASAAAYTVGVTATQVGGLCILPPVTVSTKTLNQRGLQRTASTYSKDTLTSQSGVVLYCLT
jgi:hypothetical protein